MKEEDKGLLMIFLILLVIDILINVFAKRITLFSLGSLIGIIYLRFKRRRN